MNSKDDLVRFYYSLEPWKFGFLENFELSRKILNNLNYEMFLEIRLFSDPQKGERQERMVLSFLGVRGLKVGNLERLIRFQVDIRAVREHQLENINFRVIESEYEAFAFYCSGFSAKIVS